jgi:hypothetical protein
MRLMAGYTVQIEDMASAGRAASAARSAFVLLAFLDSAKHYGKEGKQHERGT